MSGRHTIRVGGVPEHFNLPWHLAIDENAFDDLGIDVEWVDFPGGTGAIMAALADGDIDMATPAHRGCYHRHCKWESVNAHLDLGRLAVAVGGAHRRALRRRIDRRPRRPTIRNLSVWLGI